MRITFDSAKTAATLKARGLDFADAAKVFSGVHLTRRDDRFDYGEDRFISVGRLGRRVVILVWTPRDDSRRVISMRDANGKEKSLYEQAVR